MKQVEFMGFKCNVDINQTYANGRKAIILTDVVDGDSVAYATINVEEAILLPEQVIIKNYSENEGILDVLVKAKIISEPIGSIKIGAWVSAPICVILN